MVFFYIVIRLIITKNDTTVYILQWNYGSISCLPSVANFVLHIFGMEGSVVEHNQTKPY